MFNSKLKQELEDVYQKLSDRNQIIDSLQSEMMHWELDASGRISQVNELVEAELGVSASKITDHPFMEYVPVGQNSIIAIER